MFANFVVVFFVLVGYLLGSVSFAVIVSKCMGLADPHTYGSGNPGATNVLRTGNKFAAALTLLGDAAKGWLAVWFAQRFGPLCGMDVESGFVELVGLAVFVGHLMPLFHHFAGGKGVATAFGVLLGLNIILGSAALATWVIIFAFFRYSSLAALVTAVFAPVYYCFLFGLNVSAAIVAFMCVILIWRHRQNIRNLLSGTEKRV